MRPYSEAINIAAPKKLGMSKIAIEASNEKGGNRDL
ncbi:MAG: hypothetical protein RLZZ609_414 [Cyanobacteriota bacterium]|jgi:hypothetical protein